MANLYKEGSPVPAGYRVQLDNGKRYLVKERSSVHKAPTNRTSSSSNKQPHIFKSGPKYDTEGNVIGYGTNDAEVEAYGRSGIIDRFNSRGSMVGSSNDIRDGRTATRNNASKLLGGINDLDAVMNAQLENLLQTTLFSQTDQGQMYSNELNELRRSLGILSPDDRREVSDAGAGAAAQYAPMIREAEAAKKHGMPKAVVGAGERGGFMNTQWAGAAALQTTEGGDFVGAGGELERVKSVYDQNIQNAKSQAVAAKLAAEASARQAIRSGKREDYQLAQEAFNNAQTMSQQAIALANEKVNAVSSFLGEQRKGVEFAQSQEDRLTKQATDKLTQYLDLGSEFLESNKEELRSLFREAGFGDANYDSMITAFQKKAAAAEKADLPKPELRTLGNTIYSITYDEDTGTYKSEVLLQKAPTPSGPRTTKLTDQDRKSELDSFLTENNLFGTDDKVSWETYLAMKQTWVNNGGSESKFTLNYPIGTYLDSANQELLTKQLKGE